MNPQDATRLRVRREHLQLRIRRKDEARQFRELAPLLRAAGLRRFSRLPSTRIRELAPRALHLPGRDERFYWPEIPGGACGSWHEDSARDEMFVRALQASFAPSTRLLLVFHTVESGLVLAREDAIAHASLLLDRLYGTLWVIPKDGSPGLVEVSFSDNEVCWLPVAR